MNGTPVIVDETFGTDGSGEINIISEKSFTVSDQIKGEATQSVTFHAYMAQKNTAENTVSAAKEVFTTNFKTP